MKLAPLIVVPLKPVCICVACCILPLLAACDVQGTYANRQRASIASVGQRTAVMKFLGKSLTVPDAPSKGNSTGVSVTLPLLFGANPPPSAVDKYGQAMRAIFKFELGGSEGKGPILYISVVPHADGDLDASFGKIAEAMKALHPKAAFVGPDEVTLTSPANTPLDPMKHLSLTGEQLFLVKGGEASGPALKDQVLPGVTEVYVVTGKAHYVIFAYRATQEASNANELPAAIEASMRTVNVVK